MIIICWKSALFRILLASSHTTQIVHTALLAECPKEEITFPLLAGVAPISAILLTAVPMMLVKAAMKLLGFYTLL